MVNFQSPLIEPDPLQQVDRTYVLWRRRKLSYFSGCDYFRLSTHPKVRRAVIEGLRQYGLNVAASRLTSGNHFLYPRLEAQLAGFFQAESALLVPTGYAANLAVAQALAGQFSHALIDEAAHPALSDAAAALDCPVLKFEHRSVSDVSTVVQRLGADCKLVLMTDGVFSRAGTLAPLKEYLRTLPGDAVLLVDDAHGAGVVGTHGRGSLEENGVGRQRIIQTITLSKAFGVFGGAILASSVTRKRIISRSRLFIGSTPLPLPLANAAAQAVTLLRNEKGFRTRLFANTQRVRNALQQAGIAVPNNPGPIIALQANPPAAVTALKKQFVRSGIYPPFIQYPGAPAGGYFRFVISSEHTRTQLENLASTLCRLTKNLAPLEPRTVP